MSEVPVTGDWPADRPAVPGYDILGELGRGGMGVVYKARQASSGQLVALKVIRDGALAGPQARARFHIEAESAARLRHPNVVQIYEVGEHAGRPYYAMELVAGGTLDQHLAGRPLSAPDAAALIRTLALAVAHAHERQIVHRDLKPANVLISDERRATSDEDREKERSGDESSSDLVARRSSLVAVKIADFGLAKRLDSDSTAWTREGAVLGTPGYMAPEQAAGRSHDVGPGTDVYALGAMLYESLTGRLPFTAGSWDLTIQQVLHDEPARLPPDVPRNLETVCLKCLEKEPARRYADAAELAADLGRFLEGVPVAAVPPSTAERLARLAGRDGYRIVGEVGRGPRSIVYHALYEPLRQPVALKVFPEGTCTRDEWEARLRHGAEVGAAVAHPHVVTVQRAGWWAGSAYLIVEYVPNGSLAARLTGRPHPVREAVRLVGQLAEVVVYLHRQGVTHGNLKPSNVLLAADGIPRVADMRLTGGLFQSAPPTDDQAPAGVGYLPPECIRDPDAEPRPHTDVYGLGVILYELLTGRPPFDGATAGEVRQEVLTRDPVPPSGINHEVSPDLDAVCLRCLRKNPWRRFPRAYDLLARLRRVLDDPR
ncbi:MAG TPA: serine/threonine-protein kinase [Fimbriiglobus sp.]|jgi:serine/threonine protein kinase|nr:serine/threonine-protein kinase [Fimbriiglobus sp.]